MPAFDRLSLLISAALAVATPLLAGSMAWRLLDEARRPGLVDVVLYWPSLLLDLLPARAADAFTQTALWTVLLYFGGYLVACRLARRLWRLAR